MTPRRHIPRARALGLGVALLAAAALSGCVTATVQEVREAGTGIAAHESIVVLGRKHKTRGETETDFVDCVSRQVRGEDLAVMSEQAFVDATFPWFEPRTAPVDVRDFAEVRADGSISRTIADRALNLLCVDGEGFDSMDRRLLETIIGKFSGGPVGLDSLAAAVGEERDTIEDVIEPYLIQQGFLKRTPRGRVATENAYLHFGLALPQARQGQGASQSALDLPGR